MDALTKLLDQARREGFVDQSAQARVVRRIEVEHVELERLEEWLEQPLELHAVLIREFASILHQPRVLQRRRDVGVAADEPGLTAIRQLCEYDWRRMSKAGVHR